MIGFLKKSQIIDIHKYTQADFFVSMFLSFTTISSVAKEHKYWVLLCSLGFGKIFSEFMVY